MAPRSRFTQFHGTSVPIVIVFFLLPTDVAKLSLLDRFWRRILRHHEVWRGIYCRDYNHLPKNSTAGSDGCKIWGHSAADNTITCGYWSVNGSVSPKRCVWQTLNGHAAGGKQCLLHLTVSKGAAEFRRECDRITRIPGRSKEELLTSYMAWLKASGRGKSPSPHTVSNMSPHRAPSNTVPSHRNSSPPLTSTVPAGKEQDSTARAPWSSQRPQAAIGMVAAKPMTPTGMDLSTPVALNPRNLWELDMPGRQEISTPSTPGSNLNATTRSFNSSFAQRREL